VWPGHVVFTRRPPSVILWKQELWRHTHEALKQLWKKMWLGHSLNHKVIVYKQIIECLLRNEVWVLSIWTVTRLNCSTSQKKFWHRKTPKGKNRVYRCRYANAIRRRSFGKRWTRPHVLDMPLRTERMGYRDEQNNDGETETISLFCDKLWNVWRRNLTCVIYKDSVRTAQ
jgi:hypothetical protein